MLVKKVSSITPAIDAHDLFLRIAGGKYTYTPDELGLSGRDFMHFCENESDLTLHGITPKEIEGETYNIDFSLIPYNLIKYHYPAENPQYHVATFDAKIVEQGRKISLEITYDSVNDVYYLALNV